MSLYSKQILVKASIAFMLSLFLYPTSLLSKEEKTKDKPKKDTKEISVEYAALQAAGQVIDKWGNRDIPGIVQECIELNFKKENKKRNDCRANLKEYFTKRVSKEIENDLETVARSFKGEKGRNLLFNKIKERFKTDIKQSIILNIGNKYQYIFKSARESAIKRQLQRLTIDIYPGENTPNIKKFESVYLKGWPQTDARKLESALRGKLVKGEDILDEVEKLKEKIISEVLEDIKQQMEIQDGAASKELSGPLKTRAQLKNAMIRNIWNVISALKSKGGKEIVLTVTDSDEEIQISKVIERKVYGIFEFVKEIVENRAKQLEKKKFYDFCKTTDAILTWNKPELKRIITQNLEAHKEKTKSKDIFFNVYFPRVTEAIVRIYNTDIPLPERRAIRSHLKTYLKEMEGEIKSRVKELLEGDLGEVRKQIAEEQLKEFFPKLSNSSWEVPRLTGEKDESRVDIMKRVKVSRENRLSIDHPSKCFQSPIFEEIKSGSTDAAQLLDNTETKVFQKVQFLINKEAGKAWDEQIKIYEEQKNSVNDKEAVRQFLKRYPNEKEDSINKERLVSYFRERIREIWRDERANIIGMGNISEYGSPKYSDLFEYIEKEIDKILDQGEETKLLEKIKIEIKEIRRKKQQKIETFIARKKKGDTLHEKNKDQKGLGEKVGTRKGNGGIEEKSSKKKKTVPTKRKFSLLWLLLLCLLIGVISGLLICCLRNRKK